MPRIKSGAGFSGIIPPLNERASRTGCAGVDPGAHQLAEKPLRAGRRLASATGSPTPRDQVIVGEMLMQQREVTAAIALGVFKLPADFAYGLSLPGHLDRSQGPARMTGNALKRGRLPGE